MTPPRPSKPKKSQVRHAVRLTRDGRGLSASDIETLGLPSFLVRLVGREQAKRFSVPIVIHHRHD